MFKFKRIYQTLEDMYNDYKKLVYVFISDHVDDETVKDELLQIFWTKVYDNFDFLREKEDAKLKSYLRVMAKNVCMDYYRQKIKEESFMEEYNQLNGGFSEESVETEYFEEDDVVYLRLAWMILSEEEKDLLIFKYAHQLKNYEIGKLYGISEGLVAVKLQRIRKKLKEEMLKIKREEEGGRHNG